MVNAFLQQIDSACFAMFTLLLKENRGLNRSAEDSEKKYAAETNLETPRAKVQKTRHPVSFTGQVNLEVVSLDSKG